MFVLVSPPEFSDGLQLICGLDEVQRRRFIAVVVADWLDRVAPTDPGTAVSAEMSALLRDPEQLFRPENFAAWAEEVDDAYLDVLDADESPNLVRPLFYRARFAGAVSVAGEAIADDRKLDEFLYEYSFSREDVDIDAFYMAAYRSCCAPEV